MIEELVPWVVSVPLFVKYGVPDIESAYVSMLGVTDRDAARVLAERYRTTGGRQALSDVSKWLDAIDHELDSLFGADSIRLELLRRQAFRRTFADLPFLFTRAEATNLRAGEVLSLVEEDGHVAIFSASNERRGELIDARLAVGFARGDVRTLAAICTAPAQDNLAPVALVRTGITN